MKTTLVLISLLGCFVCGCNPPPIFYWGDYSETLYTYKKTPDKKTLDAHKKTLLNIISEAPKNKQRIPPGVCAEYGYLLLNEGKESEGLEFLRKEQELFPESRSFIQRLINEYQRGKK